MGRRVTTRRSDEGLFDQVRQDAGRRCTVGVVRLEGARRLLTIDPGDPVWSGGELFEKLLRGTIVRVRPPADASDEDIAALRDGLRGAGAVAVKVLPRAPGERLAAVPEEGRERRPGRTLRQVVLDRAEAARTDDREALMRELDSVMSEAGL